MDILRRLRIIEDKMEVLSHKITAVEKNEENDVQKILNILEKIQNEINNIKKELRELERKVDALSIKITFMASKEEVKAIEKYLDLINPTRIVTIDELKKILSKFVTKEELKKMIKKERELYNYAITVSEEEEGGT